MVKHLFYSLLFAACVLPAHGFAQSTGDVDVDLSVLNKPVAVQKMVLTPITHDNFAKPTSLSLDAMRRKYRVYPFVGAGAEKARSAPTPIVKPAVVFKAIPKPPIKTVMAPIVADPPIEAEPIIAPETVAMGAPIVPPAVEAETVLDDTVGGIDLTEAVPAFDDAPVETPKQDTASNPNSIDGFRVAAIGYAAEDIRLTDALVAGLTDKFVPEIQAQAEKRLGIYAYANSVERGERRARRLSLSRALELRSHLITAGVAAERIDIFALGDKAEGQFKDRVDLILQP